MGDSWPMGEPMGDPRETELRVLWRLGVHQQRRQREGGDTPIFDDWRGNARNKDDISDGYHVGHWSRWRGGQPPHSSTRMALVRERRTFAQTKLDRAVQMAVDVRLVLEAQEKEEQAEPRQIAPNPPKLRSNPLLCNPSAGAAGPVRARASHLRQRRRRQPLPPARAGRAARSAQSPRGAGEDGSRTSGMTDAREKV